MPSVPLMRARPSLALSSTGASPAAASASAAGISVPSASRTSPSPISASAQCDSGARSPEQPSDPYSRTIGVIPADSSPAISSAVSRRMPVCPVARVESRSSMSARTTSRSTSGPDPAACERTSDRCSCSRISAGMWRVASAPKPVEMPYAGSVAAASSSTTARALSIAATASSVSATGAPSRATATTSSIDIGPTSTCTVMGPMQLLRGVRAAEGKRRSRLGCETARPLVEEGRSARHETRRANRRPRAHRVS